MILVGTLHLRLISLLCVPALLLLFVLLRFCCGCEKRSPSTEHRPFLSRIVVTLVLSLATFRHIPSVSTPPLRAPRPQNRVHLQGVAKAAAASMKSHRNGSLVLKWTVGVAGKLSMHFANKLGNRIPAANISLQPKPLCGRVLATCFTPTNFPDALIISGVTSAWGSFSFVGLWI